MPEESPRERLLPPRKTPEEMRQEAITLSDISAEAYDALRAWQKSRQVNVPKVGEEAPDFELDVLTRERKRTGETVRLSSLRGKPVALVFSSYT